MFGFSTAESKKDMTQQVSQEQQHVPGLMLIVFHKEDMTIVVVLTCVWTCELSRGVKSLVKQQEPLRLETPTEGMNCWKALLIYVTGVISTLTVLLPFLFFGQPVRLRAQSELTHSSPSIAQDFKDILLHLEPPSKLPYDKLLKYVPGSGNFNSQVGQDKWVDKVFQGQKELFVVESGANNGFAHSNSLFFETERQWDCLLVEANPYLWPEVRSRHRKCHFLTAGLSITKEKGDFPFKLAGPLGGFTETLSAGQEKRADAEINRNAKWMHGEQGNGQVIKVSAFPLYQVLMVLNRTTIDYWSLDTEGSELAILQGSGLENFELGVLTVEHNNENPKRLHAQHVNMLFICSRS